MIPHILIEEALAKIIGGDEEQGLQAAVTAIADAKKGERLIVVHTPLEQTHDQLRQALSDEGLPNIYIPAAASFHQVGELPILGTGKIDLKAIKQIALNQFGPSSLSRRVARGWGIATLRSAAPVFPGSGPELLCQQHH